MWDKLLEWNKKYDCVPMSCRIVDMWVGYTSRNSVTKHGTYFAPVCASSNRYVVKNYQNVSDVFLRKVLVVHSACTEESDIAILTDGSAVKVVSETEEQRKMRRKELRQSIVSKLTCEELELVSQSLKESND